MAMTFLRPRLMRWNNNAITDHNRSELGVAIERIENMQRMANGTMRKYIVADKRTFTVSWDMLPNQTVKTVDGFWGGQAMLDFYNATPGAFTLELARGDSTVSTYSVMFSDFSYDVVKRSVYDFWNVSVTMEEV
jgi:hypothetical protein